MTRSGCPVSSVDIVHDLLERRYTECPTWREHAYDIIDGLDPAMIVTTSVNGHRPVDADDEPLPSPDRVVADGWATTFDRLGPEDRPVVYLVDTPNFGESVPDCLAANLERVADCAVPSDEARLRPERTGLITEVAAGADVSVVDPTDWFCAEGVCPAVVGNTLIARDSNHVTTDYTLVLAPLLARELPLR